MMNSPRRLILPLTVLLCAAGIAHGEIDVPLLTGRVVDNAGVLSAETAARLSGLLKRHEDSTSNQIAVLTIPSLDGEAIESFAIRVADVWKLGRKEKDNGVILVVVRDDRKVRIEVGRGLEGNLPDITCGLIIRNVMVPRFRNGDYDAGVEEGVEAIVGSLGGSYTPPADENGTGTDLGTSLIAGAIFTVVVGIFTLIVLFSKGAQAWFLYLFLLPFWLVFPMAILGFRGGLTAFACYAIAAPLFRLWMARTGSGKALRGRLSSLPLFAAAASSGWTSGSSFSSGGGSSDSGGFSGGGGGFSGGGASGSW